MPAEIGACIVVDLCEALAHAHASGIIHRDVKPENVLVELARDRDGEADASSGRGGPPSDPRRGKVIIKLTDFGIAKVLDAQGVTSTGQVLGSPAHMAPEQIEAGEVDERTDVFALGVLLYEALVGHLPFEGKNPAQVLRRVIEGEYACAERERAEVGARWSRIIDGALARDVAQRTRSPLALAALLREELTALGLTDPDAEVTAYFDDPVAYVAKHKKRTVDALVARAEGAKKRGDIVAAAADYNRAAALCPGDMALLRKVTTLRASAARGRTLRRAAMLVGPVAGLGLLAFGVVRWVRSPGESGLEGTGAAETAAPVATAAPSAAASESATDPAGPPADPTADPLAEEKRRRIILPPALAGKSAPKVRAVQFVITPPGATLSLDGQELKWFGKTLRLPVGSHSAFVEMRGSRCCKAQTRTVSVEAPPEGKPDEVLPVLVRLEMNESSVRLGGTPPAGAQYSCGAIGLSGFAGESRKVVLPEAVWTGPCTFTAPGAGKGKSDFVTLRAGEPNVVAWPTSG